MLYHAPVGQDWAGFSAGIVTMQCRVPYPPGSPNNARTFDFPVLYAKVGGATMDTLIYQPNKSDLLDEFIKAGEYLVAQGVKAVFGGCGFMVLFQRELTATLPVPVYASSLIQMPLIAQTLKPAAKIGILTASGTSLTPEHMAIASNGLSIPHVIHGLEERPAFKESVHIQTGVMDSNAVERDVVAEALAMQAANPDLGAILLECTDLPPYARAVRDATGLPVYDINSLIHWGYRAVEPTNYHH